MDISGGVAGIMVKNSDTNTVHFDWEKAGLITTIHLRKTPLNTSTIPFSTSKTPGGDTFNSFFDTQWANEITAVYQEKKKLSAIRDILEKLSFEGKEIC